MVKKLTSCSLDCVKSGLPYVINAGPIIARKPQNPEIPRLHSQLRFIIPQQDHTPPKLKPNSPYHHLPQLPELHDHHGEELRQQ